jgi:hypothetical protein
MLYHQATLTSRLGKNGDFTPDLFHNLKQGTPIRAVQVTWESREQVDLPAEESPPAGDHGPGAGVSLGCLRPQPVKDRKYGL